jgi:hypothetical protein
LNAYLLHQLPESEREALEDRWMEDSALYQQLRDAEAELLDAYARGTLPPADRERVAKYLLDSPVQRRKLRFAQTLVDALPAPARPSIAWRGIAAAAAIVLLAASTSWLVWQNAGLRRELAANAQTSRPSAGRMFVAEVRLDTTRGAAPSIAQVLLPADSQILRLDLELAPGDEAQILSASIARDGRAVWNQDPIRVEQRTFGFVASVWIPSAALAPGEYEVKLSAAGAPVDYYRFRLQRAP